MALRAFDPDLIRKYNPTEEIKLGSTLKPYEYNGARALVLLHEKHIYSCVRTWQEAKMMNVQLPVTNDGDYQSLDTVLRHILRAARGYMTWMCDKLDLPEPGIEKTPAADDIESKVDEYTRHLLDRWRLPLADVQEDKFHSPTFTSRWGVEYCIDAMLEHAVMHPIRHEFQLRQLLADK